MIPCGFPTFPTWTRSATEHGKRFHATVTIDHKALGTGVGTSKKRAEQAAAQAAVCADCGKPAKYAEITMTTTYFCKRHRSYDSGEAE